MSDLETSGAAEPDAVSPAVVRGLKGLAVAPLLLVVVGVAWQGLARRARQRVQPGPSVAHGDAHRDRYRFGRGRGPIALGLALGCPVVDVLGAEALALLCAYFYAYFYAVATTGRS